MYITQEEMETLQVLCKWMNNKIPDEHKELYNTLMMKIQQLSDEKNAICCFPVKKYEGNKKEKNVHLKDLSPEAKEYVLFKKDLMGYDHYASIMSSLSNKVFSMKKSLDTEEAEFERYMKTRSLEEWEQPYFRELFSMCYKKFLERLKNERGE